MHLVKVRYYTTLDVHGAYNLLRMAKDDKWKMAFWTWYGLYKSLGMPFGLTNVLADFQHFINDALYLFLDHFCMAHLNDILIYSAILQEHWEHV